MTVVVDGPAAALADPTRLRQALGNLVANGLRHGSHVTIDVEEASGSVVVDVADDGPGVDPAIDPFARGTSTAGSTGLGLWLARGIAEAHGGTLRLVPGPGRGPGSGSFYRPLPPRAEPELGLERERAGRHGPSHRQPARSRRSRRGPRAPPRAATPRS